MRKDLWSLALVFLSGMVQRLVLGQRQGYKNVAQLRIRLLYLRTIKTCRLLFLNFLGVGMCLVFLLSSILIFNAAFFFYAPYDPQTKMWVGFCLAAVYFLMAAGVFYSMFTEEKWLRMFHAHGIFEDMGTPSAENTEPDRSNGGHRSRVPH